jgi:hypothetical protein
VVREGFEAFIQKRVGGQGDAQAAVSGAKFLASILASSEPRSRLIEEYIRALTGDSLQSVEEVFRAVAALGLDEKTLALDVQGLRGIFAIRNKIIHELDLDLSAKVRKRKVRSQADLLGNSDFMLAAIVTILRALDDALARADA